MQRLLLQDHLDARAAREPRREAVTSPDGITRTWAERGHTRPLASVFGPVTGTRIAYRAPGERNVYPADAELNLPAGKHSHGLSCKAASAAARGSFAQACAEVTGQTGCALGTRQAQQLARAAVADFGDFYARRPAPGAAPGDMLVLECDGKGIVVRPGQLRPRSARLARRSVPKQDGRLSRGEVRTRKRMAEIGAVFDITPVPRTAGDILDPPGPGQARVAPRAAGKWLTARITADASAAFAEADRRDPPRQRTWIALADGSKDQIAWIQAEAAARGITITITCDFIHVTEYLRDAAWCFFPKAGPDAGPWVRDRAAAILDGHAAGLAAALRNANTTASPSSARPSTRPPPRPHVTSKPRPLAGLPQNPHGRLAHLHRRHRRRLPPPGKDRMDMTGARWGVDTAEAILKLRALHANGDFDAYWALCVIGHKAHYAPKSEDSRVSP